MIRSTLALALTILVGAGCGERPGPRDAGLDDAGADAGTLPDAGAPSDGGVVTIGTWNIEWFGDTTYGPSNEALQYTNVRAVIADLGADLLAVQEIVDSALFGQLVAELPDHAALIADSVPEGWRYYSDWEQKVGLVYRPSVVTVRGSSIALTDVQWDFAGRPPAVFEVTLTKGGVTLDAVVLVLHMKAGATADDLAQRRLAAADLKGHLDAAYPATPLLVLGDWNDDVDVSIVSGQATPYADFVADSAAYSFVTQVLSAAGERTTVSFTSTIDHQLYSNELAPRLVPGSPAVVRPGIASYGSTTSDHYPVVSRLRLEP